MKSLMAIKAIHSNMQIIGSQPNSFPAQPLESCVKKFTLTFYPLQTRKKLHIFKELFLKISKQSQMEEKLYFESGRPLE